MREFYIDYQPTPKQYMFHQSPAYEVLFGGAAGPGKTCAMVMDGFGRCTRYPKTNAFYFRRTRPELIRGLMQEVYYWLPNESYNYNEQKSILTFPNGSQMFFCTCQHEKNKYDYQSAQFDWLYIDELTHFTESMYDYLKTRVRAPDKKQIQPCIRAASNPGGLGHGWVKRYFVDAGPHTSLIREKTWVSSRKRFEITTRQYIPALVTENPHITDSYVLELERKPEALRRALLLGEWDSFEGQVFIEFTDSPDHYLDRKRTHVIEPFPIPPHWPRYRGFDWGYKTPFATIWIAVAPNGKLYMYREYYGSATSNNVGLQLPSGLVAQNIRRIEEDERRQGIKIFGFADPHIFDVNDGSTSVGDSMAREGVFFEKADNARLSGKDQVHARLIFDEDDEPGLYIFNNCVNTIRTIKDLPYSLTNVEDVMKGGEDHCYDALRYVLVANPMPETVTPKTTPPPVFNPMRFSRGA